MKVAGFTFIRNAETFGYPILEAIQSVLPLCDEFVVAVGNSTDNTLGLIEAICSPKMRVIHTVWNDDLREGGRVLAEETNKALAAISADADWAFYIQGDEVLHEQYLNTVRQAMQDNLSDLSVEGLLFKYLHFYGSFRYVGDSRRWYRREIRVIRNTGIVTSYRDAQGFRKKDNTKLQVKLIDAYIYHYGWVKPIELQRAKFGYFYRFWHSEEAMKRVANEAKQFSYEKHIDSLTEFSGTHPAVMLPRITSTDNSFTFDTSQRRYSLRVHILTFIEKLTSWRIGEYRNYRIKK
ncbi:glycosyltransferase family 2 protein [Fibrella forsythiae]|uniref:Glycosyltransferase family 2 protein n=1 Tax=Fibrella forsythiae TaxID=2817061 RepID=A0ABS3JML6_9BACT|nr:glycosyltransferase family 2 protein [Fibrella forsythiae]MBO0951262.1 glycosyltransferase family 2 protein [Fibrella forsythiae]